MSARSKWLSPAAKALRDLAQLNDERAAACAADGRMNNAKAFRKAANVCRERSMPTEDLFKRRLGTVR